MISTQDIIDEIKAGLPNEKERLDAAWDAYRFSEGRFEEYPTRTKTGRWNSGATRRSSPVMKRVVDVLSANLYKAQPTRKLSDAADAKEEENTATEWLGQVYRRNAMSPKWRRADQLTCIGGFCAFQWQGTEDPTRPVKSTLWAPHELVVWENPDEPTEPLAVATIDRYDSQKRLRLYTKESITTFLTKKGTDHVANGGTAWNKVRRWFGADSSGIEQGDPKANPYHDENGEPILPFSFCHWTYPAECFTTNGPGDNLQELNEHVNERLDRLGDSIFFLGRPLGVATGLDETYRFPQEIRPGDFINLPDGTDAGGNGSPPTLSFLMPELGYVSSDWEDLNNFLDHSLEMHGVPPVLIRMIQSGARSGLSIAAEQMPLLGWVEARRVNWSLYEEAAALTACRVGLSHLGRNGVADATRLQAVLRNWQFTLRWPPLYVQLPGPDRDRSDDRRLRLGLVSKVGLLMEANDYTEQEAFEVLAKVKEQDQKLQAMGIDPTDPQANPFGQQLPAPGTPGVSPPANDNPGLLSEDPAQSGQEQTLD